VINVGGNPNSHTYIQNESSMLTGIKIDDPYITTGSSSSISSSATVIHVTNTSSYDDADGDSTEIATTSATHDASSSSSSTTATLYNTHGLQPTARKGPITSDKKRILNAVTTTAEERETTDVENALNVLMKYSVRTVSTEDAVDACLQVWRSQVQLSVRQLCTVIEVCNSHRAYHKDLYHVSYWSYQQLRKESPSLSIEVYENMLALCTANKEVDDASTVLKHFEDNGYSYTSSVLQSMVRLLAKEKKATKEVS